MDDEKKTMTWDEYENNSVKQPDVILSEGQAEKITGGIKPAGRNTPKYDGGSQTDDQEYEYTYDIMRCSSCNEFVRLRHPRNSSSSLWYCEKCNYSYERCGGWVVQQVIV